MRIRLKHALVALIALVLLAMAHSPLLRAGLLASDYEVLLEPWQAGLRPLAALSIEASRSLWGLPSLQAGNAVGLALRLEHLVYLLLAGVGLGYFVRRLLLPWSGSEAAKAAGRAAALLFAVHPLVVWSVADLGARGQLLGLGLALWSALLFLRGRQDARFGWLCISYLLAVAAGFSSWLALGLPVLLASCDLTSTHRYRPLRKRLRTSATTLVLFSAAVCLSAGLSFLLRKDSGVGVLFAAARRAFSPEGAQEAVGRAAEKLGLLVLPSNPEVLGAVGIVIAGAAFLVAMQPALLAARSAPRLWGWLLGGLAFALLASLVATLNVTVNAEQLNGASLMLPSIAVMAAGLGLGATALSGPHRPYMAWVVVVAYAALAHANARPWMHASWQVVELRRGLSPALEAHGSLRTVVLDPPLASQGMQPLANHIQALLDPRLGAEPTASVDGAREALALSTEDFLSLLFEPEFLDWLGTECLLIYPHSRLVDFQIQGADSKREATVWQPPAPSQGAQSWARSLSSGALDLSPLEHSALRVRVTSEVDPSLLSRVSWRSQESVGPTEGMHPGSWRRDPAGALGWYDLSASLAWRIGGHVRKILFLELLRTLDEASLHSALPSLGQPALDLTQGRVLIRDVKLPEGYGSLELRLSILDLKGFTVRREVLQAGALAHSYSLVLDSEFLRLLEAGQPVAWQLEASMDGNTIARERGRVL
jgi:hypothetical protein